MEDTIEFSREELLAAVADRIALKRSSVEGPDDHEFITDLYKVCMTRAREMRTDIFAAMNTVLREDSVLARRFLAYVFDNEKAK